MAGQKDFLIAITLIFIFSYAIINFAISFGIAQNSPTNINQDSDINTALTNNQNAMISFRTESNDSFTAFDKSSIEETSQSGTLVTGSTFKSSPKNPLEVFKSMMGLGMKKIFGNDSNFDVIFTSIVTLILTISALLVWKTWKGGNPE